LRARVDGRMVEATAILAFVERVAPDDDCLDVIRAEHERMKKERRRRRSSSSSVADEEKMGKKKHKMTAAAGTTSVTTTAVGTTSVVAAAVAADALGVAAGEIAWRAKFHYVWEKIKEVMMEEKDILDQLNKM